MRTSQRILSLSFCVVAVAAIAGANARGRDGDRPAEVARLRAHFDSVLGELRAVDVSALSPSQRSARTELIARLQGYAAAGRFPHNHVRPGELVPVFRDEHGTLCAMGYLIASTGRGDIVQRVTSTNNRAYLPQLAGNAALRVWLDSAGLTVAEAARIQPAYDGMPCLCVQPTPTPNESEQLRAARRDYGMASAVATPFSATAMILNLVSRDASATRVRATTWLGLGLGAAQLAYGVAGATETDTRRNMGAANIAVGGASVVSAIWRMRQPTRQARAASLNILPMVSAGDGVGLTVALRM